MLVPPHGRLHGMQYAGWTPTRVPATQPGVVLDADLVVQMPDGVVLRGDLYRPPGGGRLPTLLAWAAYNKDLLTTSAAAPFNEAGVVAHIVSRGYNAFLCNPRGCGRSEGEFGGLFNLTEQRDLASTIEWLGVQPWSDGQVGMTGMSYFAVAQLLAAVQRPRHLSAVFPFQAMTDLYRHGVYHGGSLHADLLATYISLNGAAESARIGPGARNLLSYALDLPVARRGLPRVIDRLSPVLRRLEPSDAWLAEYERDVFDHPLDGPYYRERSAGPRLEEIDVPLVIGSEWGEVALHLFGAFDAWHRIRAPKKMFIGPPRPAWPYARFQEEMLAWYDHRLKGVDNGYDRLPPVRYWLMGAERWEQAEDWPLPASVPLTLGLGGDAGGLTLTPDFAPEGQASWAALPRHSAQPVGLDRAVDQVLAYRSDPADEPLHVVGPVHLRLRVTTNALDTHVMARLSDEAPDGTRRTLSLGWLQASHRTVDLDRSNPSEIVHDHTRAEAVVPGEPTLLRFSLFPTANLFLPGHRVLLEIGSDPDLLAPPAADGFVYFPHLGAPYPARNTVRHGGSEPSSLRLLVRPEPG